MCAVRLSTKPKTVYVATKKTDREQSVLVCKLSGETMESSWNLPMAFPSGSVYAKEALFDLASENGGKVACLRFVVLIFVHDLVEVVTRYFQPLCILYLTVWPGIHDSILQFSLRKTGTILRP